MKNRIYFFATLTLLFPSLRAEEPLPTDTRKLASDLAEFEKRERAKLESQIAEKRREVLILYKAQLERESKAGRLDAALAIMGLIENLGAIDVASAPVESIETGDKLTFDQAKSEFGAVEVSVPAEKNRDTPYSSGVRVSQGSTFMLIPHPADQWSGGGSKRGQFCDYRGYNPDSELKPWMRLFYQVANGPPRPVDPGVTISAEADGFIRLFAEDDDAGGNRGKVRVVVVPRK